MQKPQEVQENKHINDAFFAPPLWHLSKCCLDFLAQLDAYHTVVTALKSEKLKSNFLLSALNQIHLFFVGSGRPFVAHAGFGRRRASFSRPLRGHLSCMEKVSEVTEIEDGWSSWQYNHTWVEMWQRQKEIYLPSRAAKELPMASGSGQRTDRKWGSSVTCRGPSYGLNMIIEPSIKQNGPKMGRLLCVSRACSCVCSGRRKGASAFTAVYLVQ